MTNNDIIQQGELAKFIADFSARADFDPDTMDFELELQYGLMGKSINISKSKFRECSDGWLFSFPTSDIVGKVTAKMTIYVNDTDIKGGTRPETDEQIICFVAATPYPRVFCIPSDDATHDVTYTRTETSDIANLYERLADVYDRNILTCDGEYIYVLKSN